MSGYFSRLPLADRLRILARLERSSIVVIVIGAAMLVMGETVPLLKMPGCAVIGAGIAAWLIARAMRRRIIAYAQRVRAHGDVALRRELLEDKPHEFRVVTHHNFPAADFYFYDTGRQSLESAGFVFLADVENLTVTRAVNPRLRTFSRILSSADGTIAAKLHHIPNLQPNAPGRYSTTFLTEFNDGTFVITNNSGGNGVVVSREGKATGVFCRGKTPWEDLLRIHRDTVALMQIVSPALGCVVLQSIDDQLHQQRRLHSIISQCEEKAGFQRKDRIKITAQRILDQQRAIWATGPHQFRVASLDEFPSSDIAFYDRFRDEAASQGFSFLADQEDMTLSWVFPYLRSPLRWMLGGENGWMVAMGYQIRNSPQSVKTTEIETEFTDGTFLETTTSRQRFEQYAGMEFQQVPPAATFAELVTAHHQRVEARLAASPGLDVVRLRDLEDCRASAARRHAVKARYRMSLGLYCEADMRRTRGRDLTAEERAVLVEIEKLKSTQVPPMPPAMGVGGAPRAAFPAPPASAGPFGSAGSAAPSSDRKQSPFFG